jgi:hypothetical protein
MHARIFNITKWVFIPILILSLNNVPRVTILVVKNANGY